MTSGFLNQPWRRWLVLPVVFLLVDGLLLASISLGIRLPGFGLIAAIADITGFDYNHHGDTRFSPLSDEFLSRTLGFRAANGGTVTAGAASRNGNRAAPLGSTPDRVVLNHAFTNDNFADAIAVPSIPFTASTQTTAATQESGEPHSCGPVGGTVWYRYRPAQDVTVLADTVGTKYADSLGVFTGSSLSDLQKIACNTSALGNAQVTFAAQRASSYFFQITGPAGGGDLRFNLAPIGATQMVDIAPDGTVANNGAGDEPSISADGRYVAFTSFATNLGPHNRPCQLSCSALFVRDLVARTTELIAAGEERTGVAPTRSPTNGFSVKHPSISANGRLVSFSSDRPDLVPGDTNDAFDVFTYDRVTKVIVRDSVGSHLEQGMTNAAQSSPVVDENYNDIGSSLPSLSSDGRFVVFMSDAGNLVPNDTNGGPDIFVRDRMAGTTELVSIDPRGNQFADARLAPSAAISDDGTIIAFEAPGYTSCNSAPKEITASALPAQRQECLFESFVRDRRARRTTNLIDGPQPLSTHPTLSPDGRYAAFLTSIQLIPADTNNLADVYVLDLRTHALAVATVTQSGNPSSQSSAADYASIRSISLSSGGRFVAFESGVPDLVANDGDPGFDVFVRDMVAGVTTLASVSSTGARGNDSSTAPLISRDGSVIAFMSNATNFTNQSDTVAGQGVFVHANELNR